MIPASIETASLTLRPVTADDARFVVPLHTDASVMALLRDGVQTPEQALAELDRYAATWRDHGIGMWLLFERSTGAFTGESGVIDRRADHGAFAIRLAMHRAHWGRGYTSEALPPILDDLFARAGLDEVKAIAKRVNVASGRALRRAGLVVERAWDKDGVALERFALRREDWRGRMSGAA